MSNEGMGIKEMCIGGMGIKGMGLNVMCIKINGY